MHVVVDLSAHGYGHLSISAPVLRRLAQMRPGLRFTVRTALPGPIVAQRLQLPFKRIERHDDFGMHMRSTLEVDVEASCEAYAALHADWQARVDAEAATLAKLAPDFMFSSVSYLSLAAAKAIGVPSAALSCLNWADIYEHIAQGRPEFARIHQEMLAAYAAGSVFLNPEPGMPMSSLPNVKTVGPIGVTGRNRRTELAAAMNLAPEDRIVFISMGGVEYPLPIGKWPQRPDLRYIVPATMNPTGPAFTILETLGMPTPDVIASVDAFVTKPGYNSVVEAALTGTPVIYQRRHEWPEEPYIVDWMRQNTRCAEIDENRLMSGDFDVLLERVCAQPVPPKPIPSGIDEAAQAIDALLA